MDIIKGDMHIRVNNESDNQQFNVEEYVGNTRDNCDRIIVEVNITWWRG